MSGSYLAFVTRAPLGAVAIALSLCSVKATADVVAVISAKSAIMTLSKPQIADIFLGRASRFPGGGEALPIDQAEGSAAREEFYARLAGKSAAQMKAYWSKIIFTGRGQPPREVLNSVEMRRRISENPIAIGYIETNMVDGSVRVILAP